MNGKEASGAEGFGSASGSVLPPSARLGERVGDTQRHTESRSVEREGAVSSPQEQKTPREASQKWEDTPVFTEGRWAALPPGPARTRLTVLQPELRVGKVPTSKA